MMTDDDLRRALAATTFIALDVDGTLTDGRITYTADGIEIKQFDVKDGLGIARARMKGIRFAFISGRPSPVTLRRAEELGIDKVAMGAENKDAVLARLAGELGVELSRTLFVGDDIVDLPAMEAAGLGVAVADAHDTVIAAADWVTSRPGGFGAVREVIDRLFDAKGWK
jgi:3-deoxy-D-manno-octulosonate 8-phosphate phosphatase (KDO 8-P phosphatase)